MFSSKIWAITLCATIDAATSQAKPCIGGICLAGGTVGNALLQREPRVTRVALDERQVSETNDGELDHDEELAIHELQRLVERPTVSAVEVDEESRAFAKRLQDVFADLVTQEVKKLCDDVVNQSEVWIADIRRERLRELTKDCKSEVNEWSCDNHKKCEETECNVKCECMGEVEIEARLQNETIQMGDIKMNSFTMFQMEGLASTVKYNVAKTALEFVVQIGKDEAFRAEVNKLALKAEEQVCISIGSQFEKQVGNQSERAELLSNFQQLGTKVSQGLASISAHGAAMVTDVMKFIFSSANLVPYVGDTLHTMLDSVADYGGAYIEEQFRVFLQTTTTQILKMLSDHAIKAANKIKTANQDGKQTLSAVAMTQLEFVFKCTAAGEILSGINGTLEGLFTEDNFKPADVTEEEK